VAAGKDDPFRDVVLALVPALPAGATVHFLRGCHDDAFWQSEQPAALGFLAARLGAVARP
jgi:hypothetical protein